MYVSIQGVYQVVRETLNDQEDVYVDGGLLCNYPIHAFDGKRYFAYSILSLNKIIYIHTRQDSIYIYIIYIYIYIYIYKQNNKLNEQTIERTHRRKYHRK